MNTDQYLRLFLTVVFLFIPFCAGQGLCQTMNGLPPPVKLITVRATIKSSVGKPLMGVALVARNQSGTVVEEPLYTVHVSGMTGLTYTQLPAASGFYFVAVQTHGYVPPPAQKISASQDANLTFVLKPWPKAINLKIKNVKR